MINQKHTYSFCHTQDALSAELNNLGQNYVNGSLEKPDNEQKTKTVDQEDFQKCDELNILNISSYLKKRL